MKRLITLSMIALLCCYAFTAYTQEDITEELNAEQIIDRYIKLSAQMSQNINQNDVNQYGRYNMAQATQGFSISPQNNLVYIDQTGNYNTAIAIQRGNDNLINMNQRGNRNYVAVDMEGDNNSSEVFQKGHFNKVEQEIIGNDYDYLIQQFGNNNEIQMTESSFSSKSIEIEQKGNNMKLEISTRKIF